MDSRLLPYQANLATKSSLRTGELAARRYFKAAIEASVNLERPFTGAVKAEIVEQTVLAAVLCTGYLSAAGRIERGVNFDLTV